MYSHLEVRVSSSERARTKELLLMIGRQSRWLASFLFLGLGLSWLGLTGSSAVAAPALSPIVWEMVPVPVPSGSALYGVAVVGADDVWAVGSFYDDTEQQLRALILRWSGNAWQAVPNPDVADENDALYGVAVVSADDIWAVGMHAKDFAKPLIQHWDGSAWSIVPAPEVGTGNAVLYDLSVVSANDIWAVGPWNTRLGTFVYALHWDGTEWAFAESHVEGTLTGVSALASDDVWTVGNDHSQALVRHWDGSAWSTISSAQVDGNFASLRGVVAIGADDVWSVGLRQNVSEKTLSLAEHWNGTAWELVPSPNDRRLKLSGSSLEAVTALGTNDVWAAGRLIAHWDGAHWARVAALEANLHDIAAVSAEELWAVGDGGIILHGHLATVRPNQPEQVAPKNGRTLHGKRSVLVWSNVDNTAYYQVQLREGSRQGSLIVNANRAASNYPLHDLSPGTKYFWRVRACNAIGCSDWSGWGTFSTE